VVKVKLVLLEIITFSHFNMRKGSELSIFVSTKYSTCIHDTWFPTKGYGREVRQFLLVT
jgi:hypothetical protein